MKWKFIAVWENEMIELIKTRFYILKSNDFSFIECIDDASLEERFQ